MPHLNCLTPAPLPPPRGQQEPGIPAHPVLLSSQDHLLKMELSLRPSCDSPVLTVNASSLPHSPTVSLSVPTCPTLQSPSLSPSILCVCEDSPLPLLTYPRFRSQLHIPTSELSLVPDTGGGPHSVFSSLCAFFKIYKSNVFFCGKIAIQNLSL